MDGTGDAISVSMYCDASAPEFGSCPPADVNCGNDFSDSLETLDITSATVTEVHSYWTGYRFGPTQKFYAFGDAKAILALRLDDEMELSLRPSTAIRNVTVTGKLHLFDEDVTPGALAKWINNRHSDALYGDAPSSVEVIDVGSAIEVVEVSEALEVLDANRADEFYERYELTFRIPEVFGSGLVLQGFEDIATVYVRTRRVSTEIMTIGHFVRLIDVNRDGTLSPIDALIVINDLNENGARALGHQPAPEFATDVNSDGYVSPSDVWTVIAELQYYNTQKALVVTEDILANEPALFEIQHGIGASFNYGTSSFKGGTFDIVGSFTVDIFHHPNYPNDNPKMSFEDANVSFTETEDALLPAAFAGPIPTSLPVSTARHVGHRFYHRSKYNLSSETDYYEETWSASLRHGTLYLCVIRTWADGRQYSYSLTAKQVTEPFPPGT
jgi:hypothetical protein